jgi:hypothetical protein
MCQSLKRKTEKENDIALFLASNAARCVTGAAIPVYGQS